MTADEPYATGGLYEFPAPNNDCWWPDAPPVRSAALAASTIVYLDPTRETTIPLAQTSVAAGCGRTVFFDIHPRERAA